MAEENLTRQAELALERQGDHDSLFYEGQWHAAGSLADRAARFATGLADLGADCHLLRSVPAAGKCAMTFYAPSMMPA
jgi:hypothetical protein